MTAKDIYAVIVDLALKHGASPTREACSRFIKSGLKSVSEPTKRLTIPKDWVARRFLEQNGKCKRCKNDVIYADATGDHVVPISQGGEHNIKNIVMLCPNCNSSKNDNSIIEESKKTGRMLSDIFPDED